MKLFLKFRLNVTELPYAPSNVRISEITATSVHISWHYDGPPSEAVEFVIQYKPKLAAASDHSEVVGLKTNYYTVQGLNPFTEYEFYVVAVSAIGRGLASTATFVTTGETGRNNDSFETVYVKLGRDEGFVDAHKLLVNRVVSLVQLAFKYA